MAEIRSKQNSEKFDEEYDRIFGANKKPERGTWVQDPETGKLIPKEQFTRLDPNAPAIHASPEAFVSPIDGSVIDDRKTLRQHNAKHGVTNIQDFGDNNGSEYFKRKAKERDDVMHGRTHEAKLERSETIRRALHDHGYR